MRQIQSEGMDENAHSGEVATVLPSRDGMMAVEEDGVVTHDEEVTDEIKRQKMITNMNADPYMAKIKPEFLNVHYKPRLCTEYLPEYEKAKLEQATAEESKDGEPAKKKKKLTGRNKKRPHQRYTDLKICTNVANGRDCPFGEKCRFFHDVEKYLAQKPPDLGPKCYVFEQFGKCSQGLQCRFASQHMTDDNKNRIDEDMFSKVKPQTLNVLPAELRYRLHKQSVMYPKADKYLDSIGIKPKYGYRKAEVKVSSCSKESASKTGDTDNSVEKVDSLPTADVKNLETSSCDTSDETMAPVSNGATEKTQESKPSGCVTDEDMVKIRPGEKKTIDFRDKLYLAPLTTVGNLPFRRICKNYGVDITCGEMALSTSILRGQQSEWALLKRHVSEDLFGVQLCGGYPDTMVRCAELLNKEINIDFIDVNVGCPIDLIFKKGEGSALMGRQTKFEQIVRGMSSVLDVPLTVKIRTGIYADKSTAHTIAPKLRDWGASLVTLHGRSREQRYTKPADWDYIAKCAELAKPMPFFGNGDILSFEEYNLRKETTGVAGIMVARGALIKPWIFTEIKEQRLWDISSSERFDMLKNFSNYGLEHWGSDTQGVEITRRFLLEWISFLHRYIPVGIMEQTPQKINHRPPRFICRDDLETLMASENCGDWVKLSELLLGPVRDDFTFLPKHKANAYK